MRFSYLLAVYVIAFSGVHPRLDPNFKAKHVTSVKDIGCIKYDFLKEQIPSGARSGKWHTYIVVLKKNDNDVVSLYNELDSLVSSKIKNEEQACQINKMPKGTCKEGSYWICFIKMNELKTKSYLAEFDVQHKTFCRFSEYGTFKLGVKEVTSTSFEVDHLKTSSIWPSNQGNCL